MNRFIEKSAARLQQAGLASIALLTLAAASATASSPVSDADQNTALAGRIHNIDIKCGRGLAIQHYLRVALPHTQLTLHGVCREQILIEKDNITIVGANGASIDGGGASADILYEGVVTIRGARGVVLKNLLVSNGPDIGIYASTGAQIMLDGVTANGHVTTGIVIDNANAELRNVTANENGSVGIDAFTNSTVIATGPVTTNNNAGPGLEVNGSSLLELRGAVVTSNDNGGDGILLVGGSLLQILSFPESQGSGVNANGNAGNGMLIATSEIVVVGSEYFGSGANEFNLSNNSNGIFMSTGAISNPFGTAKFTIENNGVGILGVEGTQILSIGGLVISGNGAGLVGDAAGTFTIVSVPPNPSSIQGNGLDVDLSFGTRATFNDAAIGSINCDATVLVRGSTTCP